MEILFILFILLFWFVMAVICAMIATSKKGAAVGLLFFFYGLIIWPIALVHALLLRSPVEPLRAAGVINGKPYWLSRDGQFCATIEGKEVAFPTLDMLSAALGGGDAVEAPHRDGQRLSY